MWKSDGSWWQFEPGFVARFRVDRLVRFELSTGDLLTRLSYKTGSPSNAWLEEFTNRVEAQLGEDDGGFWIGITYSIPFTHSASLGERATDSARNLDPRPRLNLDIGGVLTRQDWDFYAVYSIIDRGDFRQPATQLPILDGGFDQRQILLGVRHRFGKRSGSGRSEVAR
jgi:hypothetical protein